MNRIKIGEGEKIVQKVGSIPEARFGIRTEHRPTIEELAETIDCAYIDMSTSIRPSVPFVQKSKELSKQYFEENLPEEFQPYTVGHCLYVKFRGTFNLKKFDGALKSVTQRTSLKPRLVRWKDPESGHEFEARTMSQKAKNLVIVTIDGRSVLNSFTTRKEIKAVLDSSPTTKALKCNICRVHRNMYTGWSCEL